MEQFDPTIIDKIVHQLKSQGIFDQFRRECMSDVDTKPAYQNLRQRVDGSVSGFLSTHQWRPDLNKNQLRDTLRKHIQNSGFLDMGVERIVDQVVNPKICPLFLPKVEEIVYNCLGVNKPGTSEKVGYGCTIKMEESSGSSSVSESNEEKKENVINDTKIIKIKAPFSDANLLPHGLEPISPASEEKLVDTNESEDNGDDEEISPPFEPHTDGNSNDSHASVHLENDSYNVFKSKPETTNSDVQDLKNSKNEENSVNIEVNPLEGVQKDLVSDDDISVKETEECIKIKTSKHCRVMTSEVSHHAIFKKTSPKSDDNDTSSVEPETSVGSSLGIETSDEFISSQDKECISNPVSKLKHFSQDSYYEVVCDSNTSEVDFKNESNKKPHVLSPDSKIKPSDLKIKISSSSSHQHKKSQSSSSKDSSRDHHSHRSHHRHDDRKSSHSSSYSGKVSNKPKYPEQKKDEIKFIDKKEKDGKRQECIDTKHKIKSKSKDEKLKYEKDKTGHKNQIESINGDFVKDHKDKPKGINLDLKHNVDNKRGDSHVENKHDKRRRSSKTYSTFKKEDHSWNGNEQTSVSISNNKDEKKPIERDKRRELSKVKHSKKHCKSSDKFREGRRSSDRDSNGQGEGSTTADSTVSSQSHSKSQTSPEKDKMTQSSNNNIVCDSEEEVDSDYSNSKLADSEEERDKEHKVITLKHSIKKKHSNVYEVRKKIQARKSLERLRKKREKTEVEQRWIKKTRDDKNSFGVKRRRKSTDHSESSCNEVELITLDLDKSINRDFDSKDDVLKQPKNTVKDVHTSVVNTNSNKLLSDIKSTCLSKSKTRYKIPLLFLRKNSANSEHEIKVKSHPKTESSIKEKNHEVLINQENEPENAVNQHFTVNSENPDFTLTKLNSVNDIPVVPVESELNSKVSLIQSVSDMKTSSKKKPNSDAKLKSRRKNNEYEEKKKLPRKRHRSSRSSETVTNSSQKESLPRSKNKTGSTRDTKFGNSRQNKVLKVINQDVRNESRYEEKDSRHSIQVVEEDIFSTGYNTSQTETDEYSNSKPPKLATKLMDVALQDLLMESGLSLTRQTEDQRRLNTNPQPSNNTNTKKLKLTSEKCPTLHQQQHYDKSDLYKPRPRFTQSSKRTRRGDSRDDTSLDQGHAMSKR